MTTTAKHFGYLLAIIGGAALLIAAVNRAPGFDPDSNCVGNQRLIALALNQYVQDNDEGLPQMSHIKEFQSALSPYDRLPSGFNCPSTGLAYQPNGKLSGQTLADFQDASTVQTFRDAQPHSDGTETVAYLDGHVTQNGVVAGDTNVLCVQRAQQVQLGLAQYIQDFDEHLPPMTTQSGFQAAVLPYVKSTAVFVCPATQKTYRPNAGLSEESIHQITDPSAIEVFEDQLPHQDGYKTYAYADGHVTHGPLLPPATDPSQEDRTNLQMLGLALNQYEQDYDEYFPPMDTYQHFEQATRPYAKSPSIYQQPQTGADYQLNTSLNGESISELSSPATTPVLSDMQINDDGALDTLYADSHVRGDYYYHATALTVGTDHKPALVSTIERTTNGEPSLRVMDLSSLGGDNGRFFYAPPSPPTTTEVDGAPTFAQGVHVDQRFIVLTGPEYPDATFGDTSPGNGLIRVWGTSPSGLVVANTLSGPYDGWQVVGTSSGGTTKNHILWQGYNGQFALWTLTSKGGYLSDVRLQPDLGETAVGVATGTDGVTWVLFDDDGSADLWTVSATGVVTDWKSYPGSASREIAGLALTPGNLPVLLWNDGAGQAEVWTLAASGDVSAQITVSLADGWTPNQFVVGPDGDYWILWKRPGAEANITRFTPTGARVFKRDYPPFE